MADTAVLDRPDPGCLFKGKCATIMCWPKEKQDFILEVCNTEKHVECTHYLSLKDSGK